MSRFPDPKYPPTPENMCCSGCGCDFKPTRNQWVDYLRRGNKEIFCARPCWRAWKAKNKADRLASEAAHPEAKRARQKAHKERWLAKKRAERDARRLAEEAVAAKLQKATREHIEAARRNMTEATRRNAPRVKKAVVGLGPDEPLNPKRPCHTCGEPTWDFNCDKCKKKRDWCYHGEEYGGFSAPAGGGVLR